MHTEEKSEDSSLLVMRVYGASSKSVQTDVNSITRADGRKKKAIRTNETGKIAVEPEIYSSGSCPGICSSSGGNSDIVICFLVIAVLLAVFVIVWAVVMIVFAIVTAGSFIRRRYRTIVVIEKENLEFITRLVVLTVKKGAVLDFELGQEPYDNWMKKTFRLFIISKYIRQISLLFGFWWGLIEVGFKLNQVLFDPNFTYDLWPFRIVMILIFTPLILFSPILEMYLRREFSTGEELVDRLVIEEPSYLPDHHMEFQLTPLVVDGISTKSIRKYGKHQSQRMKEPDLD